jgi:hypothetical protein
MNQTTSAMTHHPVMIKEITGSSRRVFSSWIAMTAVTIAAALIFL